MENRIQYPFKDDHEVMIALITDFNASVASLDRRMMEDHQDTLEIKSMVQKHYESLSQRIDIVEKELIAINPQEIAQAKKDIRELQEWQRVFNRTKHIAWVIASTGFLLMGHYLPQIFTGLENVMMGTHHK